MTYQELLSKSPNITLDDVRAWFNKALQEKAKQKTNTSLLDVYRGGANDLFESFEQGNAEIAYFYKPPNKYPARIYLFMDWNSWNRRNLRPMALSNADPLHIRKMTLWDVQQNLFLNRMQYFQYECWHKLVSDEINQVVSQKDIDKLLELQGNGYNYPLDGKLFNLKKASLPRGYQTKFFFPV